jgi:lysophospholipase L1-like esterase
MQILHMGRNKSLPHYVFLCCGVSVLGILCLFAIQPAQGLTPGMIRAALCGGGLVVAVLLALFFVPARFAQNALLALVSLLLPLFLFEFLLGYRPDLFVGGTNAARYLAPGAYLRYVQLTNPATWQELGSKKQRFDVSRLYYHYKPGIAVPGPSGTVTMDEIGFHNPPGTYTDNAVIPYVFLGDSGTAGLEAEKPFARIVSEVTGKPALNLGIGGQSPQDYATALERYGLAKKPKVVVVALFLNDVSDALTYDRLDRAGLDDATYYFVGVEAYPEKGPVGFLLNRLNLPRYAAALALFGLPGRGAPAQTVTPAPGGAPAAAGEPEMTAFPVRGGAETVRVPSASIQTELVTSKLTDVEMGPTLAALARIKALAASVGAKVLVTYMPQPIEYYRPFLTEGAARFAAVADADFGWGRQLQAYVESLGLPFFDPRPGMRREAPAAPFLFPHINDAHLNTAGHALFGRLLAERLAALEAEGETRP